MQSIHTAAAWWTPALVESSVVSTPAVGATRRSASAATTLPVGMGAVGRTVTNGDATDRNRMSHRATHGNAAKNTAIAFTATPAAGYGNRPRGTPLS